MLDIPKILEEIANTSSKNDKVAIIKKYNSKEMSLVFLNAYHPHINFGISKIDMSEIEYEDHAYSGDWFDEMMVLLTALKHREYTGHAARDKILSLMSDSTHGWAMLLYNILNKDLRAGISAKSINKVYTKLIPEEFCQLAKPYVRKKFKFPCYADSKLDGVRGVARNSNLNEYTLFSRSGKQFKNYGHIENELRTLSNFLAKGDLFIDGSAAFDGEVMSDDFQSLMRTVNRKSVLDIPVDTVYNIFDSVIYDKPLSERLLILDKIGRAIHLLGLKHIKIVKGKIIHNEEELEEFYRTELSRGFEGIMIKDLDACYVDKRSTAWMKMKPTKSVDLEIIGMIEGEGKNKGKLGALIFRLENGGKTNVGGGYSDNEREEFWRSPDKILKRIAEVEFQDYTDDGNLRFSRFRRFRDDK